MQSRICNSQLQSSGFTYVLCLQITLYFGIAVADHILIYEEMKSTLYTDNAFYRPLQNLLSSSLLPKNQKIICNLETIILPAL